MACLGAGTGTEGGFFNRGKNNAANGLTLASLFFLHPEVDLLRSTGPWSLEYTFIFIFSHQDKMTREDFLGNIELTLTLEHTNKGRDHVRKRNATMPPLSK